MTRRDRDLELWIDVTSSGTKHIWSFWCRGDPDTGVLTTFSATLSFLARWLPFCQDSQSENNKGKQRQHVSVLPVCLLANTMACLLDTHNIVSREVAFRLEWEFRQLSSGRERRRSGEAERRKAQRGQEEAGEWPCFTIRGLGPSPIILPQFRGTTEWAHISFSPQSLILKMRLISS